MRVPHARLYVHCVWATWDRLPLITPDVERRLYAAVAAKCHDLNCELIAIGGMPDHLHILVRFPSTVTIADLLKEVKGASSHLMTHEVRPGEFFKWQGSYGAFSVSPEALTAVSAYISGQKEHHRDDILTTDWERCEADGM